MFIESLVEMRLDIMSKITWILLVLVVIEIILFVLSFFIDWMITRNVFSTIIAWISFLFVGLVAGSTLKENELNRR